MKFRIFIAPANSHPNRKGRFQKTSAGRPAGAAFPTPKLSELAYPIDPHRYTRAAAAARANPADGEQHSNNGDRAKLRPAQVGKHSRPGCLDRKQRRPHTRAPLLFTQN